MASSDGITLVYYIILYYILLHYIIVYYIILYPIMLYHILSYLFAPIAKTAGVTGWIISRRLGRPLGHPNLGLTCNRDMEFIFWARHYLGQFLRICQDWLRPIQVEHLRQVTLVVGELWLEAEI